MKKKKLADNKWRIKYIDNRDCCWWLASLFITLVLAGIAASCTEELIQNGTEEGGESVTIRLEVKADQLTDVRTRTAEDTINDLYVLVYDKNGKLIGNKYGLVTHAAPFVLTSRMGGNDCTVYVFANTGGLSPFNGKEMTENELKSATASITYWNELNNATHLVMTGSKKVNITSSTCDVGTISVSRIVAKITLDFKTDSTDITITNYKVCNLPAVSYYLPNPTATETDKDDTGNTNAGKDAATELSKWVQGMETFQETFYMYENRRGVNSIITQQKDKTSANAPANATYIVINGKAGGYTATWTIYLGANNTTNFNIKRNCSYTYTIRLKEGNIADTRVDVSETAFPTQSGDPSNCYMVRPGEAVTIPVSRANESKIPIDGINTQITGDTEWEAEIVWQSSPFLIYVSRSAKSGKGPTGRFKVVAPYEKEGNAVVAIRSKVTKYILWSWHIWVTSYTGETTFQHNGNALNNPVFMDRSLGAASATPGDIKACGLYYQWGRKDPFPGPAQDGGGWGIAKGTDPIYVYNTFGGACKVPKDYVLPGISNNLANSIRNPNTFYCNTTHPCDWFFSAPDAERFDLWGSVYTDMGVEKIIGKTIFDPCPAGWRVPPYLGTTSPFQGLISGWSWDKGLVIGTSGYFPAVGYRISTDGTMEVVGASNYHWSANHWNDGARNMFSTAIDCSPGNGTYKSYGFPVRCCKE